MVGHACVLLALRGSTRRHLIAAPVEELWLETLQEPEPPPEPPPPEPPPPEPPPPEPPPPTPPLRRTAQTKAVPKTASEPAPTEVPGVQLPAADADEHGSVDTASVAQRGASNDGAVTATAAPRPALSPQFSLWLAPLELQRMVLVRSPTALLGALPGYRDVLRGSDINPFLQLRALRVFLPALAGERIMLAGVHKDGEPEVVRAAERTAASRERVPKWRGSSELRATAWLDGSGVDRGLAVHGGAFLIGARRELPRFLGEQAPAREVERLSQLRRGVIVLAAIHDVAHYVPALRSCQLRSLRISISDTLRLHLSAEYETAQSAAGAAACLADLTEAESQLRLTRELLTRAQAANGGTTSQLRTEVTHEDIARILDELCWSLRRVARA